MSQRRQHDKQPRLTRVNAFAHNYPGTYWQNGYRNHHWASKLIEALAYDKPGRQKPTAKRQKPDSRKAMAAGGAQ